MDKISGALDVLLSRRPPSAPQTELNRPAPTFSIFRVSFKLLPPALALLALLAGAARADHPPLPFALENPDGPWRLREVERTLDAGLKLVGVLAPPGGAVRALVFNRSATETDPVPPFAEQILSAVLKVPATPLDSQAAERLGYAGHFFRYESKTDDEVYHCEVFVFSTGQDRWGILEFVRPEAATSPRVFAALKAAKPVAAGALGITPFRVQADPITSFPIALKVHNDGTGARIGRIFVTEVPPDSATEKAGVKIGDEILALDGRAVSAFAPGVGRRSELGLLLIDRPPGTHLTLEIITPGDPAPRSVTLVSAKPSGGFRRQ